MIRKLYRLLGLCSATGCSSHAWDPAGCVGCGLDRIDMAIMPSGEPWCTRCYRDSRGLHDFDLVLFPQRLSVTWAEYDRALAAEVAAK